MTDFPFHKTVISDCERYRYTLHRRVDERAFRGIGFIMLNPSTADATVDDPTLRRVLGFARRLRASDLMVVNLFALRSADPRDLKQAEDPIGPNNDGFITQLAFWADEIVVGWGADGTLFGRDRVVLAELARVRSCCPPLCLGMTNSGAPRHPLYVRADIDFEEVPYA